MRLRVQQHDRRPQSIRVWLGDQEITSDLMSLKLECACDDLTIAEICIAPDDVQVDATTLAHLAARIPDDVAVERVR